MKRSLSVLAMAFFAALVLGWFTTPRASAGGPEDIAKRGRTLFVQYCASCHGLDGKGQGPVASAMKVGPPDLTMIKAPREAFPLARVVTVIDGETDVAAHGTRKMPVWGTVLRQLKGQTKSQVEIYTLAHYIESIQVAK